VNILNVEGNIVTLVYNPGKEKVEVGDNIVILDRGDERGVLVQVIQISVPELPGMLLEIVRREASTKTPETYGPQEISDYKRAVEGTKYAIARIMMEVKKVGNELVFEKWRGYVPSRNADYKHISPSEVIGALRKRRFEVNKQ
jgi:hypothetical protein